MKEVQKQESCIACGYNHTENYCPNCGEVATLRGISFKTVLGEAFSTFINMDKGYLYNLRGLTFTPKSFIQDYISGRRKGVFNPISYLIISISLYLISVNFFPIENSPETTETLRDTLVFKIGYEAGTIIKDYFKFFWIVSIFFLAAPSALIYSKNNFAEHVTISSFLIAHSTLLVAFLTPLIKVPLIFNYVLYAFVLILYFRTYMNENDKFGSFIISFLVVIVFFVTLFLFTIILGTISYFLF